MSAVSGNTKIAKNTIALYIRMGFTMIISFFTTRVTLQILGVDNYGLNNLVGSIVSMFSFINASMGTAVQRYYSVEIGKKNEDKLGRIFGVSLYLHFIVAFITFIFAEIFAFFFLYKLNIPQERMFAAQIVFQISVISLVFNIVNVPYAAFLRAKEEFSKMAIVEIIQAFLRLGVLYLLYKISYDKLIVFSLLNFCVTLYYITSITILARKYQVTKFKIIRDKELVKEMFGFISFLLFTILASIFRDKGLIVLINLFFSLAINAAYAIAAQIMGFVNSFAMNFKQSVVPQLMSAYGAGDRERMYKLMNAGTKITFLMLLMITFPIIMNAEYMLHLWLGEVPRYGARFTSLILINVNVSSFTYFIYQAINATGKIKAQQIIMSVLYFFNIVLIYVFFKLGFDFYSAIYVTIGISSLQCIVNLFFANMILKFNVMDFFKNVCIKCGCVSIILFILLIICNNLITNPLIQLLIGFIITVFVCVVLGFFMVMNKNERTSFLAIIHKTKKS